MRIWGMPFLSQSLNLMSPSPRISALAVVAIGVAYEALQPMASAISIAAGLAPTAVASVMATPEKMPKVPKFDMNCVKTRRQETSQR